MIDELWLGVDAGMYGARLVVVVVLFLLISNKYASNEISCVICVPSSTYYQEFSWLGVDVLLFFEQ